MTNLDDRIRSIDPARDVDDDLASGDRARGTLARIVATHVPSVPPARTSLRRPARYAAAAIAAAGALVFVPIPGPAGTAYAGWVATAEPASPAVRQSQGATCISISTDPGSPGGQDRQFTVSLVEVRGDYAYTVITTEDGFESTCLNLTTPGPLRGFGQGGRLTQEPEPRGIAATGVQEGQLEPDHALYQVTGKVGSDVTAVTINAPGVDVHATIQNGRFAAWWPGQSSTSLFGMLRSTAEPNPDVTLTFRDGTTRRAPIKSFRGTRS